jgi:hypothetical protein
MRTPKRGFLRHIKTQKVKEMKAVAKKGANIFCQSSEF